MQPFSFKKKETVFYSITLKLAVTHILKTLLAFYFYDVDLVNVLHDCQSIQVGSSS